MTNNMHKTFFIYRKSHVYELKDFKLTLKLLNFKNKDVSVKLNSDGQK